MFANRVAVNTLIDQLGAESYDPEVLRVVAKFANGSRLGQFLIGKPQLGVTGTIADSYVPPETPGAVPYITTKQVAGLFAYAEDCKYITSDADKKWKKCRVRDGAILINKSGNVGAAAILRIPGHKHVNSVSDIINIALKDGVDTGFLVVFLNSPYGQKQLQRLSGGAVFDHVSIYAIPEIRLFTPSSHAQTYIGEKVRLAERLQSRSRHQIRCVTTAVEALNENRVSEDEMLELLRTNNVQGIEELRSLSFGSEQRLRVAVQDRYSRVPRHEVIDRINAEAYSVEHLENARRLESCRLPKRFLREVVREPINNSIRNISDEYGQHDASVPMFRPADIEDIWLNPETAPHLRTSFEELHKKARVFPGDIVMGAAGSVAIVGRVPSTVQYGNINGSCARIAPLKGSEGYLLIYLASRMAKLSLMRLAVGSVQKHLNLEDIPTIQVVWPGEQVRQEIGRLVARAEKQRQIARSLIRAATSLVENLIDGKVSESELSHAQALLEKGDSEPDRAILARLYEGGIDENNTKSLFPDLDAYYQTIRQLGEAEPVEEAV